MLRAGSLHPRTALAGLQCSFSISAVSRVLATRVPQQAYRFSRIQAAVESNVSSPETDVKTMAIPTVHELWRKVLYAYDKAQSLGAAYQTDTNTELFNDESLGVEFVIRSAKALRDKPKPPKEGGSQAEAKNPFLPYEEDLFVADLSATHLLLLNKFNVVAHHMLAVTWQFEPQSDLLNANDLDAAWTVLQAMPEGGVAFYNAGEVAGASQRHKHLQIVPLPLAEGLSLEPPFTHRVRQATSRARAPPLIMVEMKQLPWQTYACDLPQDSSEVDGGKLEAVYRRLLDACLVQNVTCDAYNLILVRSYMMLVPRSRATCGPCSLNALGYAGTLLVKSQEELDFIREHGPMRILEYCGIPWKSIPGT